MTLNVYLGIWTDDKLRRIKVDDVDLESNVEILKPHMTKELGDKNPEQFQLIFCGTELDDKKPLGSYGVSSGVTIHVVEKHNLKEPSKPENIKITEDMVQNFVTSFRHNRRIPRFRSSLHALENPAELDKIIAAVPGLERDPIAIAFISKPELLNQMEDPKVCWQIAERNPVIFAAAQFIVNGYMNNTLPITTNSSYPAPSTGISYALDLLSDDDDEMEGDGPSGGPAITAAHLAAALAAAAAPPRITPEMLQQALSPAGGSLSNRFESQLRQMRELGLHEEGRNIRALTATAGDVQAAIDLIFSGAFDD